MSEAETKQNEQVEVKATQAPVANTVRANQGSSQPELRRNTRKMRQRKQRQDDRKERNEDGFDHKIINIRRVSRMYKGGRRMRLSVFVVVGDKKGKVGVGLGKGSDVRTAQQKAISAAKKNLVQVQLKGNTIPHEVKHKVGAAKVLLKPASPGTGIIAGSSVRSVAEMAGVKDILSKILGTNNSISNAYATLEALRTLRASRL